MNGYEQRAEHLLTMQNVAEIEIATQINKYAKLEAKATFDAAQK